MVVERKQPEAADRRLPALTVIVPCCNERAAVSRLHDRLDCLRQRLLGQWRLELLFVDDGSQDGTAEALRKQFADWPGLRIVGHLTNRGIAAAIMTGLRNSATEWVASLDADCSYDPLILAEMLQQVSPEVDLITASPYHPAGMAPGAGWRIGLSRICSWMYRVISPAKLFTYTSCVRLYRRRRMLSLELDQAGFVGVAELLLELAEQGGEVREHPAELSVRREGASKLRIAPAVLSHLRLWGRYAFRALIRCPRAHAASRKPSV